MRTILSAAQDLEHGRVSARALVEECLSRIADPAGEGARAFITVQADQARAMAEAADLRRKAGRAAMFEGIPISLKDLVDIKGEVTTAGSVALAGKPAAAAHAPVVARLLAAGFIPVGRSNMTEFAFSGLGINPHYGTPAAPWDRASRRIPGGSSAGAGVSVADGMALGALGTDTGGSCRIPAAYCGVVGYKPTARRVPIEGVVPLSTSLDSIGPLARTVADCAAMDAVMSGQTPQRQHGPNGLLSGLRIGVPENFFFDGIEDAVATAFNRALATLEAAGARLIRFNLDVVADYLAANAKGGFAAAEAYAWHQELLAEQGPRYDPMVRGRIERGASQSAADYVALLAARRAIIARADAETSLFDVVMAPTTPILPPPIASLNDAAEYTHVNLLSLRNCAIGNFLDRCAISLPCHRAGEAPVGLMLMGETMGDARLFTIAAEVEAALQPRA